MMINIITLHSIYNPGSVLQAYGLQKFLQNEGYNVKIIDYRPFYSTIGKNKIKGFLRKILFYKNELKLKNKYEEFIKKKLILTDRQYHCLRELEAKPPKADIYISGSDQLWNMDYDCGKDDAYYLSFVKEGIKISYATSIGKKHISEKEANNIIKKIKNYKMLSVREESNSVFLTKKLNKKVQWVCDPVLLLSLKEYKDLIKEQEIKKIEDKYVVIYLSSESDILNKIIEDIKGKTDYKIILLGGNRTRCKCDIHIKDIGPYEFLSLLYNSEIVISSSFHATVFSHIFHKKFGVILPNHNGERIESLLNLSNLTDHIINENNISNIYNEINFKEVDEKLNVFINSSKHYLLSTISLMK